MTDQRLAEIIRDLQRELEAIDRAIALMEQFASIRSRLGRPPKVLRPVVRREPRGRR